ncbi:UDP-N-acetyl-D-mannosaminuronic acid dehydrogenase [Microtetraspora sp. NBRC 13810]|uniref:nucleotide sugar dehydrogenase n=1 Tax=Microtetraspora sp. NBRC 13810 TaxID=3030990 RepID=UPI0024A084B6|nr:nucleotide sugar dehydrogenase [Microtetraspora sp. NBRC 13810]GLW05781.1 UDP-N-acetyl-D-mannosaminuronic acid dehydrogenase [Microtetraspora sp. NBRC 13810]
MPFLPDNEAPKVAVIGLGYVGSCLAATLAGRGLDVTGVDIDARLVEDLAGGRCRFQEPGLAELLFAGIQAGTLRVTTDYAAVQAADVILIAVGTPIAEDGSLADEQLRGACTELYRWLRPGQLVVLKCTVPPGTSKDLVLPLLERSGLAGGTDFGLAFTPERLAEGSALSELRAFPIVVGGLDAESTRSAGEFWHRALGVETIPLESLEAAEVVKLADNWWIDLNIALGNELAKYCDLFGVDVLDVIAAANTLPKGGRHVNILLPSVGVGGSCLTKDPWMVWRSAREQGLEIATASIGREINAGMPDHTARLIVDELVRLGKDPDDARIAVLGLAFKNDTGDLRETPVRAAVAALTKAGAQVSLFDPLVDAAQAEELFGIAPAGSLREAVRDADCLAVLALHKEFQDIDFAALPVAPSCLILDGRAYYSKEKIAELRTLGYLYRGIGR